MEPQSGSSIKPTLDWKEWAEDVTNRLARIESVVQMFVVKQSMHVISPAVNDIATHPLAPHEQEPRQPDEPSPIVTVQPEAPPPPPGMIRKRCPFCGGRGWTMLPPDLKESCEICNGKGSITVKKTKENENEAES